MATSGSIPLDEIVYNRPEIIQWWVSEMGGQPMDENLIYRYVSESPFFDWTTKNGLLFQQAQTNMDLWQITLTRKAVEDFVRNKPGTEYLIVGEPQLVADKALAAQGIKTGVWVIRKQNRERLRDAASARASGAIIENGWELTTLATYFIIGENVYQAPSVSDIISNRLLSANSSLNKFISSVNDLASYEPSTGYTYLPTTTSTNAKSAPPTTTNGLSTNSPTQASREPSVIPGATTDTHSLRSTSLLPSDSTSTSSASSTNPTTTRLIRAALQMSLAFDGEHLDDNPLTGEPGAHSTLTYVSSVAAMKKRRADEEAAARAAAEEAKARKARLLGKTESAGGGASGSGSGGVVAAPAVFTDARTAGLKMEKGEKGDRRASRMGEKVKRRKSRLAGAGGTAPSTQAAVPG